MLYWIWLSNIKGIGPITQKKLLDHFKSPYEVYRASEEEIKNITGVGDILSKKIKDTTLEEAEKILDKSHDLGINILTYEDKLYPQKSKEFIDSPTVLYYKGHIREDSIGVGIVGSRKCSEYGKEVTKEAAIYLAENNICVISGMAKGIDGYAHTACLKTNGYTIAFLGSSVDICYPKEHAKLMDCIIENGAVISEYPPTTSARAEHFPRRNMLISSFSNKLLVVEAAAKSGALITAEFSKDLKREVYAVPNNIYSKNAYGTNYLIEQGAKIYLRPSQLIDGKESDKKSMENINHKEYSFQENQILKFIKDTSKTLGQISDFLKCDEVEILDIISILEINGDIRSLPGGRFKVK